MTRNAKLRRDNDLRSAFQVGTPLERNRRGLLQSPRPHAPSVPDFSQDFSEYLFQKGMFHPATPLRAIARTPSSSLNPGGTMIVLKLLAAVAVIGVAGFLAYHGVKFVMNLIGSAID